MRRRDDAIGLNDLFVSSNVDTELLFSQKIREAEL